MTDQKSYWNELHTQGDIDHYSDRPTDFAIEVSKFISPQAKILELGCGVGNDAAFLAKNGYDVVATDFSDIAIKKNTKRYKTIGNLVFQVLDMSAPLGYEDNTFDVVYARLSLHYFKDEVTQNIFKEIYRVLKPNGLLCFICKSVNDPLYGQGKQLEADMFELEGHIRHFFSEGYVKKFLAGLYNIVKLESGNEKFYGSKSAFVKVIARKR